MTFPSPNCCPISERTGGGRLVGRCFYLCVLDNCPRHGDVSAPFALYRETGKLTDERDIPPRKTT